MKINYKAVAGHVGIVSLVGLIGYIVGFLINLISTDPDHFLLIPAIFTSFFAGFYYAREAANQHWDF